MLSADGQHQFALKGFRPIIDGVEYGEVEGANDPANPFPTPTNLLTVDDDFESWCALSTKFFDEEDGHRHQDHRRLRQGRVTAAVVTREPTGAVGAGRLADRAR